MFDPQSPVCRHVHNLVAAAGLAAAVAISVSGCGRGSVREYPLRGQVVAVDEARQQVTIRHEDIPQFMPGMTMAFTVRDKKLLKGRTPGELVTATLVVAQSDVHLRALERTGFAPIPDPEAAPRVMNLLQPGERVRDAALIDETRARRRIADWQGDVLAVTFTYTLCPLPNFCPLIDRHFQTVQSQILSDASLKGRVRLLSVSFDPERDTPAVLAKRAAALKADPSVWHFLTGARDELEEFASQFGVSVIREQGNPEIVHNLRTAIVDADGRLRTILNGSEWMPADLMTALRDARAGR